jgi:hypothetical protein
MESSDTIVTFGGALSATSDFQQETAAAPRSSIGSGKLYPVANPSTVFGPDALDSRHRPK